mgnify:CR=1 FL=1
MSEDEIFLSINGDQVTTMTYVDEAFMLKLIKKVAELGVEAKEVKFVPCG